MKMNEYKLTVTLPDSSKLYGIWDGLSKDDIKEKIETMILVDSGEGLWVKNTFLPEYVIKKSIFTFEKI
jgi:hypothetical protein